MIEHKECLDKLKRLRELRDAKAEFEAEIKKIEEDIAHINNDVTDYFLVNNLQNMKLEGIGMFYLKSSVFPQIEDQEALFNWLKDRGDMDLMMSFNSNKFRSYYKERIETNQDLPPGTTQFIKNEIGMRRS